MKSIDYNTLFEMIRNGIDLSPYYGARVVDEDNKVLFVITPEHHKSNSLISNARIEVIDASGKGISEEELEAIKEKISQALDDDTLEKLLFDSDLPRS